MEDWVKWVIGVLISVWTAVISGAGAFFYGRVRDLETRANNKRELIFGLSERVSLLEARPVVDPMENIKAMGELANTLNRLVSQVERLTSEVDQLCTRVEKLAQENAIATYKPQTR